MDLLLVESRGRTKDLENAGRRYERYPSNGRSGFHALESQDGQFLYYDVENNGVWTIWRTPVTGGQETLVVKIGKGWPNWTVTANGICFINEEAKPLHRLEFFSFATGRTTVIATNGNDRGLPGLSVSPDGRWILYTEDEFIFSDDIMLVENLPLSADRTPLNGTRAG